MILLSWGSLSLMPPSLRPAASFDHLVGAGEHGRRNVDAQRPRGFEIDKEVEFCRQRHRQLSSLFALHDPTDIVAGLPIGIGSAGAVADEAAGFRLLAIAENRREGLARH